MVYVMCMCVLNNEYKEVCGCDLWRLTKLRQWCVVWRRTYTTASVSFRNRNCSRTASKPCTRNTCTKTWWVNGLMWWRSSPLKLAYCIRMGSEFFTCRMLTACSHWLSRQVSLDASPLKYMPRPVWHSVPGRYLDLWGPYLENLFTNAQSQEECLWQV